MSIYHSNKPQLPLAPHYCVRHNRQAHWATSEYPHAGETLRVDKSITANYVRIHIGDPTLDPVHYIELNTLAAEKLIADLQDLISQIRATGEEA